MISFSENSLVESKWVFLTTNEFVDIVFRELFGRIKVVFLTTNEFVDIVFRELFGRIKVVFLTTNEFVDIVFDEVNKKNVDI